LKVILFGATGMVGQGVLRECFLETAVDRVLSVVRNPSGQQHPKLTELVHENLFVYSDIESQINGYDACFFCLGVTSSGMTEQDYSHITYDLTMAAARTLVRLNPAMTFIYVSGAGTDSTEKGRTPCGPASKAKPKTPFSASHSKPPICSAPA
jgi:putative NADH-flavin reductase